MEGKFSGLQAVLDRNRLQQKHVAEDLDLSRNAVWMWCAGRSAPSGINLLRLLAYLRRFEPTLTVEDLAARPVEPAAEARS